MYCIKCGTKNDDNSKFCVNCGNELETQTNNNVENQNVNVTKSDSNNNVGHTNLSIASLVCLIIKFLSIFVGLASSIKCFFKLPWLLASLILAIISRVKYKDKMSKVLLIVDIILLVLEIILFIIAIVFLSMFISSVVSGCNDSSFIEGYSKLG